MWELFVPDAAARCMHGVATAEIAAPTFPNSCPFNYAVLALACMSKNPDDRPPLFQIQDVLQALNVEVTTGQSYLDWTGSQRVCRPPLECTYSSTSASSTSVTTPSLAPLAHSIHRTA